MSNPDPSKVLFSSRYKYFLNKDIVTGSRACASRSVGAGEFTSYGLVIPMESRTDYSQVRLNFSQDPNRWYIFPTRDVDLDATFKIAVTGSYNSDDNLNIELTVFDNVGTGGNTTAFTLTARVYFFEPPTE